MPKFSLRFSLYNSTDVQLFCKQTIRSDDLSLLVLTWFQNATTTKKLYMLSAHIVLLPFDTFKDCFFRLFTNY